MVATGCGAVAVIATDKTSATAAPSAVDVGFSQDMIAHHEQAIAMSQAIGGRGAPRLKVLADGIIMKQLEEIGRMRGWLSIWQAPALSAAPTSWMPESNHGLHGMPGMASTTDLAKLQRLDGAELDRLFLRLMTHHHRGGIEMADHAARQASHQAVRDLAGRMVLDQIADINHMTTLLRRASPSGAATG